MARSTEEKWLQAVKTAAAATNHARAQLYDAIASARSHGVTWQRIGDTLNISRQAAQQRFKGIR